MSKYVFSLTLVALVLAACGKKEEAAPAPAPAASAPAEEKVLNIYNWPDYIPEGMIAAFEKETGIKVNYDTFETNEALNGKLVAGNTGYDIVVPGTSFSPAQVEAGFFQPLDRAKLKNYGNLDGDIMAALTNADPGNQYLVPWAWGFTTVGINRTKVEKVLGKMPMPENAWDLAFKPPSSSPAASPTSIRPPRSFLRRCTTSAKTRIPMIQRTTKQQWICWPKCAKTFASLAPP